MGVLRKLFGWLLNRWVVSVLGLLLLVALIWFVGPLIAFAGWEPLASVDARLVTIIIVVAIWLIKNIWAVIRARKTNADVIDGLTSGPLDSHEGQASQEEVEILRDRFKESLAVLKKAKLGGRGPRRQLYQLPWYVIIGPPGAGKTTALKNSGLKFPLMDHFGQDAIRGVGGTRNCDWWFTDEAVILDTAGRYTTQDSDQAVDSAAWGGFLQLLKKHRRRRPIDGVIVAFSSARLDPTGQRGAPAPRHGGAQAPAGADQPAEGQGSGLYRFHQVRPGRRLHRVFRRPGPGGARPGLGHDLPDRRIGEARAASSMPLPGSTTR